MYLRLVLFQKEAVTQFCYGPGLLIQDTAASRLRERDLNAETVGAVWRDGPVIVEEAKRCCVDLNVVGSRGHKRLGRLVTTAPEFSNYGVAFSSYRIAISSYGGTDMVAILYRDYRSACLTE